jgi:hypothetical protein
MQRSLAFSVSIATMVWAASAAADSPSLRGSYGFTGTAACLVAPGNSGGSTPTNPSGPAGFNSSLQPLDNSNSFSHSFSVEGIRTFSGNGTGTVKGTAINITVRPTPGPPPALPSFPASGSASNFSYNFTYTVNGDGSFSTTMVPGTYSETYTAGPRTGQTATTDAIPPLTGLISQDSNTLIVAHTAAVVETTTFSNGDVWPEICHRSRVLIKLQSAGDNDGQHGGNGGGGS